MRRGHGNDSGCEGCVSTQSLQDQAEIARRAAESAALKTYGVERHDSAVGVQAYVAGTSLAVWEVAMVARDYEGDAQKTARRLRWPLERVQGALRYAQDFPDDIRAALAENDGYDFEALSRLLPHAQRFVIDEPTAPVE